MSALPYQFSWQNPVLRASIYPFRLEKLRDFLLIYKEIDLWSQARNQRLDDPAILARLQALSQNARQQYDRLTAELEAAISERLQSDAWFARIASPDPKNLAFKRKYYLDRLLADRTQRQAELLAQQKSLLRRVEWYAADDSRRQTWQGRAAELNAPIQAIADEIASLSHLRGLYDQLERLPRLQAQTPLNIADLTRGELNDYQQELGAKDHDELVSLVWEKLQEKRPDGSPRFAHWFQYMVIHFSGMRYMSAHGSWADPAELLDLLVREDLKGRLAPGEDMDDRAENEILRLMHAPDNDSTRGLPPVLKALVLLRAEKASSDDPLPDWVWQEILRFTQLRLGVQDPNWEAASPERWQFENRRWAELMNTWERADITAWRQKHAETLDLIVTRAVCNEVAEHIQHLRGVVPPGGLTSKPRWYLNQQNLTQTLPEADPRKAFFRRPAQASNFRNGASLFWLGWTDKQPNAWQVAVPLPGVDLLPGVRIVDGRSKDSAAWNYRQEGNSWCRTRRPDVQIPPVQELRRRGMTDREIEKYRQALRAQNAVEKQYLRWKHEATVVEVAELVDGPSVLTFETGKIGLNWHALSDLLSASGDDVFVGYVPPAEREPEELAAMLDESRILPSRQSV